MFLSLESNCVIGMAMIEYFIENLTVFSYQKNSGITVDLRHYQMEGGFIQTHNTR